MKLPWYAYWIALLFCWPAAGCALLEPRWLTAEEDAEARALCEPVGGCVMVPVPQWEMIKRALGMTDL